MITPSFALTATERVLPRLALDFTTASLDARVTFTRTGNTATVTNSSGVIAAINADLPRFDFNPTTLVCRGLLIEEARTNALLNSLIDGTDLATQLVTVTAAARTLSFYGTGTVVLSGAHSATVVGAGAYPTRTTLTFTPIAGVLTLTVTGTVQFAQLELGAFATSFIPTDGTTKTRNADLASITGTNFSDWYNSSAGTFVSSYTNIATNSFVFSIQDAAATNRLYLRFVSTQSQFIPVAAGVTGTTAFSTSGTGLSTATTSTAYDSSNIEIATLGAQTGTSFKRALAAVPTGIDRMFLGSSSGTSGFINSHLQKINYYPQYLTPSELSAFSK
jgi:hypothetical protein